MITKHKQSNNKLDTKLITKNQHQNKNDHLNTSVRLVIGLQRNILFFIYQHCKKFRLKTTNPLPIETISLAISASKNTTKMSIQRLEKKEYLIRSTFKNGRGGWSQYELPDHVYNEISTMEDEYNLKKTDNKLGTKLETNLLHSSSSIYNITTTNTPVDNLNDGWKSLTIEPLSDIGFTKNHLTQLSSKELNTPDIVQESINHFAYGLKYKKKQFKTDPLNVLMGVLRKGEAWIEQGYRSPQEIAQAQLLEQRQAEKERVKQLQEDAYNLALADWLETLSEEEKATIAPAKKAGQIAMPQSVKLSIHFKENVWAEKKAHYLVSDE